jgi:hypothetical protein
MLAGHVRASEPLRKEAELGLPYQIAGSDKTNMRDGWGALSN